MKTHNLNEYLKVTGIATLSILTLFLIVLTIKEVKSYDSVGENDPTEMSRVITVSGHSDVKAVPDVATFGFSVNETGATVQEAQDKAAVKINKAIDYLKKNGIAVGDINNEGYNTNENYDYTTPCVEEVSAPSKGGSVTSSMMPVRPCTTKPSGYMTSQTVEVKIHNIKQDDKRIGQLIAALGAFGVKTTNAYYTFDNPQITKQQARLAAIADARKQAEEIASALGVHIKRVTSFTESYGGGYPMMYGSGARMDKATSLPVAPEIPVGEQNVSADVSVTYSLR